MITSIDIRNLGVIAGAHADFGPGLTVVTGETGAGKTMVLSSLLLLLGGRADAALVRQGAARSGRHCEQDPDLAGPQCQGTRQALRPGQRGTG